MRIAWQLRQVYDVCAQNEEVAYSHIPDYVRITKLILGPTNETFCR